MAWPSLREFLCVPDTLTGRGVCIAIIDGDFPPHPDITSHERRRSLYVRASEQAPQPVPFNAVPGPWRGGAHGLWAAAAAAGTGAQCGGVYPGIAPDADLVLVATYLRGQLFDIERNTLNGLHWVREHWQEYGIRGVLVATGGQHDSGLLPWQAEPQRILCEELVEAGLLVLAGSGNAGDTTADVTQAASPSVLSVGGIIIPTTGDIAEALPYHGSRGITFEDKHVPELLAPAENVVLPYGRNEDWLAHFTATTDRLPRGYARTEGTSFAGPIALGAAACIWQAHPTWTARQMRQALIETAHYAPQWLALDAGVVAVANAVTFRPPEQTEQVRTPFVRYQTWRNQAVATRLEAAYYQDDAAAAEAILSLLPDTLPSEAIPLARGLLAHPSFRVRVAALCVLATQPASLTQSDVLPLLDDNSAYVRMAALYALERCPPLWDAALPDIAEMFRDASLDIRYCAVRLAGIIKHPSLVAPLISGLEEDAYQGNIANFGCRYQTLKAITGIEMPRIPPWQEGECPLSERSRQANLDVAARWRAWLATHE